MNKNILIIEKLMRNIFFCFVFLVNMATTYWDIWSRYSTLEILLFMCFKKNVGFPIYSSLCVIEPRRVSENILEMNLAVSLMCWKTVQKSRRKVHFALHRHYEHIIAIFKKIVQFDMRKGKKKLSIS